MKSFLIVHSLDYTTSFLSPIVDYVSKIESVNFQYFIINPETTAEAAIEVIKALPIESTIVFLGHGSSHCIYLPDSNGAIRKVFINGALFKNFSRKNFISLSCRSGDFISNNFEASDNAMLGFEDLPTHWDDIRAEIEMEANAYEGITQSVLECFRDMLVKIFKFALNDTISHKMDFQYFYCRLRLYASAFIAKVNVESISDNPPLLSNILYEFKKGIRLLGNANTKIA